MYFNDGLAHANKVDLELNAREQARVHEALLELGRPDKFRLLIRFVPAFGRRARVVGEALEALRTACAQVRQWISFALDGELADFEQALLGQHLAYCVACSSFQARSAASTTIIRETPAKRPERAFDLARLVRITRKAIGM